LRSSKKHPGKIEGFSWASQILQCNADIRKHAEGLEIMWCEVGEAKKVYIAERSRQEDRDQSANRDPRRDESTVNDSAEAIIL
jgi:hypothetical protein